MKNLKKYMGLLLALVMCLSLTACGSNAPETLENIAVSYTHLTLPTKA